MVKLEVIYHLSCLYIITLILSLLTLSRLWPLKATDLTKLGLDRGQALELDAIGHRLPLEIIH